DDRIVILSDALWHNRFGASPDVLGRSIELDGISHIVVGVLPPGFRFRFPAKFGGPSQERVDLYKPWRIDEQTNSSADDNNYPAVARHPAGKTEQQALA